MAVHHIRKGLNLPISGAPEQAIHSGPTIRTVALIADDYIGLKPTMFVQVGDVVKRGQPLFEDKKSPGTIYTAPGAGTVTAVNRGEKRALQSVVIALSDAEVRGESLPDESVSFSSFTNYAAGSLNPEQVKALLVESGLWTSLRRRPYSKVAHVDETPHSIFVTATDTNPLAPSIDAIYAGNEGSFEQGLAALRVLCDGALYLCKHPGSAVSEGHVAGVTVEEFEGVHPAGTVGLHIHRLDPVFREKTVWHLGLQDVIAIGKLFATGTLDVSRVVAVAGPQVAQPRLVRTRLGASIADLTAGALLEGENRTISGSVLSGRKAAGDILGYLGRYHQQVSVLREGREREFLGWLGPGLDRFSMLNVFVSKLMPGKKLALTTSTNGSERPIVPVGVYEKVMPLDIMPTHLLRFLVMSDVEKAEMLGCLELDEEDLALCTFVCPGKYDYGPYLRSVLTRIEKEG